MLDDPEMERIASPFATVSDKIRALAAAGYERARIARFLGKRYQHVRNVLEHETLKLAHAAVPQRRGVEEAEIKPFSSDDVGGVQRLDIQPDGSIRLPPAVEQAMGWRRGGVVIAEFQGDRLVLLSTAAAVKQAQEMVQRLIPPGGPSLVDELIADRRREAEREAEDE
jgi:hypothetical protein